MGFTGDEFVGLDNDALGDAGADTQPLDTWLQNRIWGNTRWLAQERRCICWSPAIDNADNRDGSGSQAGVRPFCLSQSYITVWKGSVLLMPRQTGVTLVSVANIWMPSAVGDNHDTNINYRLGIRGFGRLSKGTWAQGDNGTDPQIVRDEVSFEFRRPIVSPRPVLAYFELAIKSETDLAEVASTTTKAWARETYVADESTVPVFFIDSTSGNPDGDSLEVQILRLNYTDAPAHLDMLGVDDGGVKPPIESIAYPLPTVGVGTSANQFDGSLLEASFYAPRCLALIPDFDSESAGKIPKSQIAPPRVKAGGTYTVSGDWLKGAMDAAPALEQVAALTNLHKRPRLISMGPRGELNSAETEYYDKGYRKCWPFVQGDAADTTLLEETLYLTTEAPDVELHLVLACLSHDTPRMNLPDTVQLASSSKKNSKRVANLQDLDLAKAAWDFTLDVDQLDDQVSGGATWASDSTSMGSDTYTELLQIHAANRRSESPPIGRSLEHNWHDDFFPHKEGGIMTDLGDEEYLQPLRLRVSLTSASTATRVHKPMRLKLDVGHDESNSANDYLLPGVQNGTSETARLRLYIISYALWEIPQ